MSGVKNGDVAPLFLLDKYHIYKKEHPPTIPLTSSILQKMNTATLFPKTTEVGPLTNIDDFPKVIQILETVYKEKVRLAENEKKDRAALEAEKDRSERYSFFRNR